MNNLKPLIAAYGVVIPQLKAVVKLEDKLSTIDIVLPDGSKARVSSSILPSRVINTVRSQLDMAETYYAWLQEDHSKASEDDIEEYTQESLAFMFEELRPGCDSLDQIIVEGVK
jgi:hypothetical protein